jgi:homoserine dehydrogenase
VGETMFYGRGAGELPTASAVVGDIVTIVRSAADGKTSPSLSFGKGSRAVVPMGEIASKYYLRITVKDSPGVLAAITRVFADNDVSITTVQQSESMGVDAEIVIMTHRVREAKMQQAVVGMKRLPVVVKVCALIRAGL